MKGKQYWPFECVLVELWDSSEKKLKLLTSLPSILKHLYDYFSSEMSKDPLSFDLGNKPPNLPKKNRLILLFGVVNLSRFSLWLVVGSPPTIAVLFLILKTIIESKFFVIVSSAICCLDTKEVPLTLQWLWKIDDLTCVNSLIETDFSFKMPWHCEIILSFFPWGSDTLISLEFFSIPRNCKIWHGCNTDLFLLTTNPKV